MRQLDHTVAQRLLDQLHAEMVQRLRSLQQRELDEGMTFSDDMLDLEHREMDQEIEQYTVALRNNDFSSVSDDATQTLRQQDVKFDEKSPEFRYMCIELLKQKITHREVIKARCLGDFRKEQELLGVQPQRANGSMVREANKTNPRISEAWVEFFAEKTSGLPKAEWNENTAQGRQAIADELIAILGDNRLSLITRDSILEYRDKVSRLPKNRKKLYPGVDIADLLDMDIPSKHLPASRTVDEKLVAVRSFLIWCRTQKQYIDTDPSDGVKVRAQSRSYAPFTYVDLQALFMSKDYLEKKHRKSWQFWIPLIALYTGARQNEIAQLMVSDIAEEEGVWVFNITDAGDDQKIKSRAGIRKVPISSRLIELGLVDYASVLSRQNQDRLFPDLKKGSKGWGQKVSRWFNDTYKKKCGIEDDVSGGRKVSHSFRHTAITKAMSEGLPLQHCQQVFGHEKRLLGETATYTHGFSLNTLLPVVESLDFGLDHSKLTAPVIADH